MKTIKELTELATKLGQSLNRLVTGDHVWLERPLALAALFVENERKQDVDAPTYEDVCSAFWGLNVHAGMERLLRLEDALRREGFIHGMDRAEIGNGTFISAIVPHDDDGVAIRAVVLESQNYDFIIVLNQESKKDWAVHVRRIWRDIFTDVQEGRCSSSLANVATLGSLHPATVVQLASAAMKYSDDLPGVDAPSRPSLQTYLKGSLISRSKNAGVGLQFGDFRDPGYVVSMSVDYFTKLPEVKKGAKVPYSELTFVLHNLHYGAQYFGVANDK